MKKFVLSLLLVLTISVLIVPTGVKGEPLYAVSLVEQSIESQNIINSNFDNIVEGVVFTISSAEFVTYVISETITNSSTNYEPIETNGGEETLNLILPNSESENLSNVVTNVNLDKRSRVAVGLLFGNI